MRLLLDPRRQEDRRALLARTTIVCLLIAGAVGWHKCLRWKKFDTVRPGVLYRSGLLRPWQLELAIEKYRIRTIFSFTAAADAEEAELCQRLGVARHLAYLPGDGVGPDDPYLRFLQLVDDPTNHPMLVHCSAGVQRTGGAVALYRTILEDRPFETAVDEMIAAGNKGRRSQIDQLERIRGLYERPVAFAEAPGEMPLR